VIRYRIAWRAMPNDLPPWAAGYQQTQSWMAVGCFETLAHDLCAVLQLAAGREAEPIIFDSRTLRSTPESGPGCKHGSKLHLA
jgi:transposase